MDDEIIAAIKNTEKTGEPVVRNMEYAFPNSGYKRIADRLCWAIDSLSFLF